MCLVVFSVEVIYKVKLLTWMGAFVVVQKR